MKSGNLNLLKPSGPVQACTLNITERPAVNTEFLTVYYSKFLTCMSTLIAFDLQKLVLRYVLSFKRQPMAHGCNYREN